MGTDHSVRSEGVSTQVIAGRYALLDPLGRGGMGTVWRARDELLERDVAVKEVHLPPSATEADRDEVHRRFLREARTAARLNHPNAVTVFDVVDDGDTVHLVMELVRGRTLADAVADTGALAPPQAAEVGLAVLAALEDAHSNGIVHRDLKPSNVMLLDRGGVKLADFGIAVLTGDPRITRAGVVMGSPSYMPPEQAEGKDSGPEADLWGLGALLYFAVEGRPPFDRGEPVATLHAVVHGEPAPFTRDGALTPLILDLLSKDPADRPPVVEIRRRLQDVLSDASTVVVEPPLAPTVAVAEPVVAAPPRVHRPRSERRRAFPVLPLIGVAALLLALVGFGLARTSGHGRSTTASGPQSSSPSSTSVTTAPKSQAKAAPSTTAAAPTRVAAAVPKDWTVYTEPTAGYSIAYPKDWRVQRVDGTRTDFRDPHSGTYLRVDWTATPGSSAVGAWKAFAPDFASRHPGYREIRIEPTAYRGYDAAIWEYTYPAGGTTLHAVDLGFVTAGRGFALNFQTADRSWSSSQRTFESFKASFTPPAGR